MGLTLLTPAHPAALGALIAVLLLGLQAAVPWWLELRRDGSSASLPRLLTGPAYVVGDVLAAAHAAVPAMIRRSR